MAKPQNRALILPQCSSTHAHAHKNTNTQRLPLVSLSLKLKSSIYRTPNETEASWYRRRETMDDLVQQAKDLGVWNEHLHGKIQDADLLEGLLRQTVALAQEKQTLTQEKQTLTQEKQTLTQEKQTLTQKYQTMGAELKRRSLGVLQNVKNPLVNHTDSDPHVMKLKHKKVSIQRTNYDFKDGVSVPYNAPYTPTHLSVNSETDVQSFIYGILCTIASDVSPKIHFAQNRRIAGVECDILLLYGKNHIPFAAVEVKKNGGEDFVRAIFEDAEEVKPSLKGKVQGEHLTQLEQIQLFGFEKVFGVITDGNHSMITCTQEFSHHDLETSSQRKRSALEMNGASQKTSPDNAIKFVGTRSLLSNIQRSESANKLYCSNHSSVPIDGWDMTLKLLTHFVMLAHHSVDPREFRREVKLNIELSARKMKISLDETPNVSEMFAYSTIEFTRKPDLLQCLLSDASVQYIYLFKHLGLGVNGDCCLATTKSKRAFCAVKFFADRESAQECAEKEGNLWNTIYKDRLPETRVVLLPSTDGYLDSASEVDACLCMPYLLSIDGRDARKKALEDGSIKECLLLFAEKGYIHREVRWRHLGWFRISPRGKTGVYLCDLGENSMRARNDQESDTDWNALTSKWIRESLQHLSNTAEDACEQALE